MMHHPHAAIRRRQPVGNLTRPVPAAVVHDDDLVGGSEPIQLAAEVVDYPDEVWLLIMAGQENAESGQTVRGFER